MGALPADIEDCGSYCLVGNSNFKELKEAMLVAAQRLHLSVLHDKNP